MSQIRVGDRVAPILAMHMTGRVLAMEVKSHRTMMVDGPLDRTTYVKVQHDNQASPVLTYRIGELMRIDD